MTESPEGHSESPAYNLTGQWWSATGETSGKQHYLALIVINSPHYPQHSGEGARVAEPPSAPSIPALQT